MSCASKNDHDNSTLVMLILLVFDLLHWLPQSHQKLADVRPDGVRLSTVEVVQDVLLPEQLQEKHIGKL